jgi:3-hydroxyacyl-CoA dehydrogenase
VIGLHFFSPANVMKLLEIVRGAQTGKDVLATALALAKNSRRPAWCQACATALSATV